MSKIVKMAMLLVALTATFSFGSYGFRAGFNFIDYSTGDSKIDKYVKPGYSFGGGLVTTIPLNGSLNFVSELSFLYRKPMIINVDESGYKEESYETEYAISVPIMFQLALAEGMPYFAAGVQLDTPISPKIKSKVNGGKEETYDANGRESLDFGLVLGIGYLITPNIGLDGRAVIGLTEPSKNGDDSWKQYGAGLTYYF